MTFEPLTTARLTLRPLRVDDAAAVFRYRSRPEVYRFQRWEPHSVPDVEEVLRSTAENPDRPGTWFQLGIFRRDQEDLIGDCGLHFPQEDSSQVEIGITLAPEHQGIGYAAEALRSVAGYVFDILGKHRVYGSVDPGNEASIRLLERLGMRREAHFVESLWFKGRWSDDIVYGLLAREWRRWRPAPDDPR